ncbi:hypothetical protein [Pseudorhodoplanes sp.]|uniref:hypothetical protein n=1 Tax=Pseudorhodoplanes sp. TaxID=1934341 RepID=UPI003D12544D
MPETENVQTRKDKVKAERGQKALSRKALTQEASTKKPENPGQNAKTAYAAEAAYADFLHTPVCSAPNQ